MKDSPKKDTKKPKADAASKPKPAKPQEKKKADKENVPAKKNVKPAAAKPNTKPKADAKPKAPAKPKAAAKPATGKANAAAAAAAAAAKPKAGAKPKAAGKAKAKPQGKKPPKKKTAEEKKKQAEKHMALRISKRVKLALAYVQTWKSDRSNWRFQKTNQGSLVKNFLNGKLIPDSAFPDVLSYFKNMLGNDRDAAKKSALAALSGDSNEKDKKRVTDRARQVSALWK